VKIYWSCNIIVISGTFLFSIFSSLSLLFFTAVVVAERTTATTKATTTTATFADTHIFTNQKSKRILPHTHPHTPRHTPTHTHTDKRDRQENLSFFMDFLGRQSAFADV